MNGGIHDNRYVKTGNVRTPVESVASTSNIEQNIQTGRERYFTQIANGLLNPFIAMTGLPGSGKSFVMKVLASELDIAIPDRAIPRPRRGSDPVSEIEWSAEQQHDPKEWKTKSFGHQPFPGKWYAFHKNSLISSLRDKDNGGVFLQVGHPIDLPTLADSARTLFPLVPFVSLHVYAPLEVIRSRLISDRPDSPASEITERLGLIDRRQAEDATHLPLITQAYGTITLLNYKPAEAKAFGISELQLKLLSPELILMTTRNAIESARSRSQRIAQDILTPRQITFTDPRIPQPMVDVIQNQILPALSEEGISPAIFAGLGAVLYGSPRRVSDDFDFETPWAEDASESICRALTRVTGQPHEMEVFAWDIAPCWGARCKLESSAEYGNKKVDIDANLIPRFCAKAASFCFEFPYDAQDHYLRRTAILPNGSEIALVSPERILVHKLIMGRGVEVDKFDLLDCAAILATQELDASVLHKMLHIQKFRLNHRGVDVDSPSLQEKFIELQSGSWSAVAVNTFLQEHGVSLGSARTHLALWLEHFDSSPLVADMPNAERTYRKLSAIKQSAMACRMIESLDKIIEQMHEKIDLWNGESTFAESFNEQVLRENVQTVRAQFLLYACFEIGQQNTTHFVNRGIHTDGDPTFANATNFQAE
jgi:hypothetical protein